jgi:hypothetical protein
VLAPTSAGTGNRDNRGNCTGVTAGRRQLSLICPSNSMGTSAQSLSYTLTVGASDVTGLTFALARMHRLC